MIRKKPKQNRSSSSIDFISEATIQVLDVTQDPKFTTNHIAERAGVSIGTLYRYFPDKGALLRFVVRKELARMNEKASEIIEASKSGTAQALMAEAIEVSMMAFDGRTKATHAIREMVALQDPQLVAEAKESKLLIIRRLHDQLRALDPSRFPPISNAQLEAASDAFRAAILTLGKHNPDRVVDLETRSRLVLGLLNMFSTEEALTAG